MSIIQSIISFFTAMILFFNSIPTMISGKSVAEIEIDATKTGNTIPNIADNINVWYMGTQFYNPEITSDYNIFEFVKYVQLMQCTGGTAERDLFKDPYDTSTMTDYDFTRLIKNCKGILKLGAKPHLKLGGVPIKFTENYKMGSFDMNIYPPDDYNIYYNYIKAITLALVEEFGLEEVKTWRFGCMTEYENGDWFQANIDTDDEELLARESAIAYCKLYDYTVKALCDVLGDDIFVGAHSMTVTEGIFDERLFIDHVAHGTNYATGEKGTLIKFLSASFYDTRPGKFTSGKTLPETVLYLKEYAEKQGLTDLIYGIDEGRILVGNSRGSIDDQLNARIIGDTWQAAYDARLFKQGIDAGLDYFSSWYFLSGGILDGNPTVSYHVASNLAQFENSKTLNTTVTTATVSPSVDIDCLSAWDEETETLRLMVYNFKNDVNYSNSAKIKLSVNIPQFDSKEVTVIKRVINDNANFFDEWRQDRVTYNITDDQFSWSPDDPIIESTTTLSDARAREIYFTLLRDKYAKCSALCKDISTAKVKNNELKIEETIGASNVVFYEIKVK